MTRIIYGVSGEGSGHSSRAREMLTHLIGAGHKVKVLSYDRGARNLKPDFDVFDIAGLHIVSRHNRVAPLATVGKNLRALPALRRSWRRARALFESFRPDCVITDFEPTSAYLARRFKLPLISLDNQHRMRFMAYGKVDARFGDEWSTRTIIRLMVTRPCVSLVTTFFYGEVSNDHTFLFPPILRDKVLNQPVRDGDHVLVYVTQKFDGMLDLLRTCPDQPFKVYGFDERQAEQNIEFRPFSVDGFLDDLGSARAVIATAGFTLMTEALHLGKPCLAMPMRGQFEQMLNGHLLVRLGYGDSTLAPSPQRLRRFLDAAPRYREQLREYPRGGNEKITGMLDRLLADDEALLRQYYEDFG